MASIVSKDGTLTPLKFRYEEADGTLLTIKIDHVLHFEREKKAGNIMFLYQCRSLIRDQDKIYELKYEPESSRWFLWKI